MNLIVKVDPSLRIEHETKDGNTIITISKNDDPGDVCFIETPHYLIAKELR